MQLVVTLILSNRKQLREIGAVIRSGKVIGDNVNIGANDVVTHDIPFNCVVGEH